MISFGQKSNIHLINASQLHVFGHLFMELYRDEGQGQNYGAVSLETDIDIS